MRSPLPVAGRSVRSGLTEKEYAAALAEAHETMVRAGMTPMFNPECSVCGSFEPDAYRRLLERSSITTSAVESPQRMSYSERGEQR